MGSVVLLYLSQRCPNPCKSSPPLIILPRHPVIVIHLTVEDISIHGAQRAMFAPWRLSVYPPPTPRLYFPSREVVCFPLKRKYRGWGLKVQGCAPQLKCYLQFRTSNCIDNGYGICGIRRRDRIADHVQCRRADIPTTGTEAIQRLATTNSSINQRQHPRFDFLFSSFETYRL